MNKTKKNKKASSNVKKTRKNIKKTLKKKYNLFMKHTRPKYQKKLYSYIKKKDVHGSRKLCKDYKHIGDWCLNQRIRLLVENNKDVSYRKEDVLSAKKIYSLREKYLIDIIQRIYSLFYNNKSGEKDIIYIYPTGSENLWSDKDVQISLNLAYFFKKKDLIELTDIIQIIRKESNNLFFKNKERLFDNYYDINFYMPSLFHYVLDTPCGRIVKKKFDKYCYSLRSVVGGNKKYHLMAIKPDFSVDRESFLYNELKFIIKDYTPKLHSCYVKYKDKPSSALSKFINCVQNDIPFSINDILTDIVYYNSICAEMYFTVCTPLFVVWFIQINNSKSGRSSIKKDLKYLSIPAFVENYILFLNTNKKKYKERMNAALSYVDKPLLKKMLGQIIKNPGEEYSKERYLMLKTIRAELS